MQGSAVAIRTVDNFEKPFKLRYPTPRLSVKNCIAFSH